MLDREFLDVRSKLLLVAASLDRLDRAEGNVERDPRRRGLAEALDILSDGKEDRAERIQMLFSRQYDADWKQSLDMPRSGAPPR